MKYRHITLDLREAVKTFHIVLNDSDAWKHVIIHLGCFLFYISLPDAVGKFMTAIGFEEIVYKYEL